MISREKEDATFSDHDFDSKSQENEKAKTAVPIISQNLLSIKMGSAML